MNKLAELLESVKYGNGNVLAKDENFVVTKPLNTWDTNYRLYDSKEETVYLIDCGDVHDNQSDLLEYGGILYQDLLSLNVDEIKENAWKTEKGTI